MGEVYGEKNELKEKRADLKTKGKWPLVKQR
jgi:hypothetical protein